MEKVIWPLTPGEGEVQQQRFANLLVRKDDSEFYFCSAADLLRSVEKKTLLVVVSPPQFTVRPPARVFALLGDTLKLNCSATGDLQPVINWKKQDGQLPVGSSQQTNGELVIRDIVLKDQSHYICVATSTALLNAETGA